MFLGGILKKTAILLTITSAFALSGCSAPAGPPYGGGCEALQAPLFKAMTELQMMSTKTDSIKNMQQAAWDEGYNTLGDWMDGVTSNGKLLDTLEFLSGGKKLTSDEQKVVDNLVDALSTPKLSTAITMPLSNESWWVDTPNLIAEIGGTCDRYISEQNAK